MRKAVLASIVIIGSVSPAMGSVAQYQPSMGTMPTSQGWSYLGDGSEIGAVSGGTFSYGPTATAAVHYWDYEHGLTIDFSQDVWHMEASVRLTDTYFGNNSGFRRGGFVLFLEDDFGRGIIADLGSNAISLRNDNNGLSDPSAVIDLASAFRTVRLEAGPSGGRLLVDGVEQMTLGFGTLNGASAVQWGEASILAYTGLTEVGFVNVVPAPGAAAIAGLGMIAVLRRRR